MIERRLLAILLTSEGWRSFSAALSGDFFSSEDARAIYRVIRDIWNNSSGRLEAIDLNLVRDYIDQRFDESDADRIKRFLNRMELNGGNGHGYAPLIREAVVDYGSRGLSSKLIEQLAAGHVDPRYFARAFEDLSRVQASDETVEILEPGDLSTLVTSAAEVDTFATGLVNVDRELSGGLRQEEMGLVLGVTGEPGSGKTMTLCHLGAQALRSGHPVIHFSCGEIIKKRVYIRYLQNLLDSTQDQVKKVAKDGSLSLPDDLPLWAVMEYSSSGVTTSEIRDRAAAFANQAGEPPLIIVDHLEVGSIIPRDRSLEGRHVLTALGVELREIALELNCGLWTAQQASREAMERSSYNQTTTRKLIEISHAAEGLGPSRKADVVISWNQSAAEADSGTGRFAILKARDRAVDRRTHIVVADKARQRFRDLAGRVA